MPIYLGLIAASSAALVGWMLLHHSTMAGREPLGLTVLMALLMLFPASEAAIAVINRLISESARRAGCRGWRSCTAFRPSTG